MVTSRDVARAAGVSQATVSRVVSAPTLVSEQTRARVQAAMEEVGYVPNRSARAMRTGRTGTVGVVVADLTNPFYPQLVESLSKVLDERSVRLTVWIADGGQSRAALAAIGERAVDGVIFTTVREESAELRAALDRRHPVVLVNRTLPSLPCDQVSSANEGGAALATRHLLEQGCRRLAFLGGSAGSATTVQRARGFASALAAAGLHAVSTSIGAYSHASGRERAAQLLSGRGRPDGFVCANDLLAFGVLDAIRERGLRVPEEVRVVGYDDVAMAQWSAFDLTTVRQDSEELARVSAELLLRRIASPHLAPRRVEVDASLVIRGSSVGHTR